MCFASSHTLSSCTSVVPYTYVIPGKPTTHTCETRRTTTSPISTRRQPVPRTLSTACAHTDLYFRSRPLACHIYLYHKSTDLTRSYEDRTRTAHRYPSSADSQSTWTWTRHLCGDRRVRSWCMGWGHACQRRNRIRSLRGFAFVSGAFSIILRQPLLFISFVPVSRETFRSLGPWPDW